MADLSRYLRRFRRLVSPPGRAAPGAVPSDRRAELSDELAEVFAAIDEIEQEAERIRGEGEEEAERRRDEADEHVERILNSAREETEELRAEEAANRRQEIEDTIEEIRGDAEREAEAARGRSQDRIGDLADRVVDLVVSIDVEEAG